jgi:hypothetical protein
VLKAMTVTMTTTGMHGDDDADSDDNSDDDDDEPKPESRDDELFPQYFIDRKLFEQRAPSDDGDTSSELLESVGYHTPNSNDDGGDDSNNDGIDDNAAEKFSDDEDR